MDITSTEVLGLMVISMIVGIIVGRIISSEE